MTIADTCFCPTCAAPAVIFVRFNDNRATFKCEGERQCGKFTVQKDVR